MEILENIIHPQSAQRIELLSYVTTIAYMILLPYLGLLLSSTLLSCMFNCKGKRKKNPHYIKMAKDLITLPTFNLHASLGIVLLPLFALMFTYAQIVQASSQLVFDYLFYLIFLIVPAVFLIYIYKDSFELNDISVLVNENDISKDNKDDAFKIYSFKTIKLLTNSPRFAFYLLIAASYILIAGITLISDSSRWETATTLSDMLWNDATIISFLYFFSASLALTSILALYVHFKPTATKVVDNEYARMSKRFFLNTAMIFILVQPILHTIDIMSVPKVAISNSLFGISIGIIIILLIVVSLLYHMLKEGELKHRGVILFLYIGLFALLAVKVQVAFNTSSQLQVKKVLKIYNAHSTELSDIMK